MLCVFPFVLTVLAVDTGMLFLTVLAVDTGMLFLTELPVDTGVLFLTVLAVLSLMPCVSGAGRFSCRG